MKRVLLTALAVLTVAACGDSQSDLSGARVQTSAKRHIEGVGPPRDSIDQLARESDVVAIARVGPLITTFDNRGGDENGPTPEFVDGNRTPGLPMELRWLEVQQRSQTLTKSTSRIVLMQFDQALVEDSADTLKEGQTVLVFLTRRTNPYMRWVPVPAGYIEFFVPLNAGILDIDVSGRTVTARSSQILGLKPPAAAAGAVRKDAHLTVEFAAVRSELADGGIQLS